MVKIKAWINATINSIPPIKIAKGIEAADTQTLLNTNIKQIKESTKMCPAVMLANKRIINAIGLVKIPINSNGIKNIFIGTGTPGIQKICFQ